jgi:hypothetical protein
LRIKFEPFPRKIFLQRHELVINRMNYCIGHEVKNADLRSFRTASCKAVTYVVSLWFLHAELGSTEGVWQGRTNENFLPSMNSQMTFEISFIKKDLGDNDSSRAAFLR